MREYKKVGVTVINSNKSAYKKARSLRAKVRNSASNEDRIKNLEEEIKFLKMLIKSVIPSNNNEA